MHSLQTIDRYYFKKNFSAFIKEFWPIVEPGSEYIHGWHIDAICDHLIACKNGEIKNLIINMPPRCMKSLIVSVFFPVWLWTFAPETRFIYASYAQSLSVRDSVKCRRLIESHLYQTLFGDIFKLTGDQNTKTRFENDKTGYRIATSVGGATTGEGGSYLISDDPQSAAEATSEAIVQSTLDWYDNVFSTRGNDPKTVVKIVVMQRLAENDVTGHLLAQGGYEHLVLPMEYNPELKCKTSILWQDPRTEHGELLWPERFNQTSLDELQKRLGSYGFAGQMNQSPAPKGGGMFKRQWFETVRASPYSATRSRYWDRAATVKKNGNKPDWTVGVKIAKDVEGIHYIEDIIRFQDSPLKVQQAIRNTAHQDGYACKIMLEQEPGASGVAEVDMLIRSLGGFNAGKDLVQKDKITRAQALAAHCEAGNVKLVAGPWNEAFLKELEMFPFGEHDDQVDAASGAYNSLNGPGINYEKLLGLVQKDLSAHEETSKQAIIQ